MVNQIFPEAPFFPALFREARTTARMRNTALRRYHPDRKAAAWAWAHCREVRGSRPVTSRTSGWGCDSSSVPVT